MSEGLELIFKRLAQAPVPVDRPRVTLTYAQSVDQSIASNGGQPLKLSGKSSLQMTHRLRSMHDSILVGIGTVLADDPRLTARHGFSPNPRPIVLDSALRIPRGAEVLRGPMRPIIATAPNLSPEGSRRIPSDRATIVSVPQAPSGGLDLPSLLTRLRLDHDIQSLMVEGGARVIQAFLESRIVDFCIITIAPVFVNGLRAANGASQLAGIRFVEPTWAILGNDAVLAGELSWPER